MASIPYMQLVPSGKQGEESFVKSEDQNSPLYLLGSQYL